MVNTQSELKKHYSTWIKNLSFELQITNRCNLCCSYCFIGEKDSSDIPISIVENLCSELVSNNYDCIFLSGGEIFCHPQINQILEILIKNKITPATISNGTLINEVNIPIIKRSNMEIGLSFDGREFIHDTHRGIGSFKVVENSIRLLQSNGINFSLICSLTKTNINQIQWIIDYCLKKSIKNVRFQIVFPQGFALNKEFNEYLISPLESIHITEKITSLSSNYLGNLNISSVGVYKSHVKTHGCKIGLKFGGNCHYTSPPWPLKIAIDTTGNVIPFSSKVSSKYKIGTADNLFKSLEDYFGSNKHFEFLYELNTIYNNIEDEYKSENIEVGNLILNGLRY